MATSAPPSSDRRDTVPAMELPGLGRRLPCRRAKSGAEHLARGLALESVDPEQAMVAYRRAVAARPDLSDAHNNLGRLLHERGRLADAEVHYRRALEIEPIALHWYNLGVLLEDGDRFDEAIDAYRQALGLDDRLQEGHQNIARLLELRGHRTGAIVDLQAAVRHVARLRSLRRTHG